MKLIIDIDEEILTLIKAHGHLKCDDIDNVRFALEYGTPIDKGDLIMFNLLMTTIADKGVPFEEVLLLIDNSKSPDNPSGDCISREALIREIGRTDEWYKGRSICNIIDNAPPVEPERPQGDLISREALKEECANVVKGSNNSDFIVPPTWNKAMELIDKAPTVDLWQMRQEATENALKKAEVLYDRPKGKRMSLDLAKRVIAKFEGYLDDDMIARIQIALEKECEAEMWEGGAFLR